MTPINTRTSPSPGTSGASRYRKLSSAISVSRPSRPGPTRRTAIRIERTARRLRRLTVMARGHSRAPFRRGPANGGTLPVYACYERQSYRAIRHARYRGDVQSVAAALSSGDHHGQCKRPQHQEEAEVQELRGQGPAEEGRQGGKVPALRRDRGTVGLPCVQWHIRGLRQIAQRGMTDA